jgi:hypothetical protein
MVQPTGPEHRDVGVDALQIRDTELLEIPVSQPSALTSAATFRVEVPVM